MKKEKIKSFFKAILNWKYALCCALAWLVIHGWEYAIGIIGVITKNNTLVGIFLSIYAFTYLPICPENLLIIPISIWFQKRLFPNDENLANLLKAKKEEQNKDGK